MRRFVIPALLLTLFYTRFVGLDWGLPYPMHPDERNMAVSIEQLSCNKFSIFNFQFSNFKECLNPHFFAYGQFPLYLAYLLIQVSHLFTNQFGTQISFTEATLALRFISAISSILNSLVLVQTIKLLTEKKLNVSSFMLQVSSLIIITFSPYFIQFSHFGTTESLLMLLYSTIIYICLRALSDLSHKNVILLGTLSGLAIATKISSISFIALPILMFLYLSFNSKNYKRILFQSVYYLFLTVFIAILFSPHNILNWKDFLASMSYESAVGTGTYKAFYTRQFDQTIPILFQLTKIFPYTLGLPQLIIFLIGFTLLPWKNSKINFLRVAFLIYFIPTSFLYAKWTRFMAPVFPLATLFSILVLLHVKRNTRLFALLGLSIMIIPGIAYLSIYQNRDVRFKASDWIYKNIPANSKILSETANVVDLPLQVPGAKYQISSYQYISFDFYNLENSPLLQQQLSENIQTSDYIFIPSRRVFANYTCIFPEPVSDWAISGGFVSYIPGYSTDRCTDLVVNPALTNYYEQLFYDKKKLKKDAEFTSYPQIKLFGKKLLEFRDEPAEETWTVFDHPVIRIYKSRTS